VIGWAWEGTAEGRAGCGVSDDEDRAQEAAEAWLMASQHGTALLGQAYLSDDMRALSASWRPVGEQKRARRLPDGRIAWARIPTRKDA
jgi:hypothetical protein